MNEVQSREGGARVRVPPPLYFVGTLLIGAALPGLRLATGGSPRAIIGLLLIAAALLLGGAAVVCFRRTGQDPAPWKPSPELVVRGPFRFTRNPMYVGMTLLGMGVGVLAARGWMIALALAALLAVHFFAVLPEEAYLADKFGEPYRSYLARVRRYL